MHLIVVTTCLAHQLKGNTMRAHEFIIENILPIPPILNGIHTEDELQKLLKSSGKPAAEEILDYANKVNYKGYCEKLHTDHPVLLYHGAPEKFTSLKITSGRRAGFLGDEFMVQNKGIFLSSDIAVANFFGDNRSKYPNSAIVHQVYANLDRLLDLRDIKNIPPELHKIGLKIINADDETNKKRLANMDIWRLMDTSFVDSAKQSGYNSIRFYESKWLRDHIKKNYHTSAIDSYIVFSEDDVVVINKENDIIATMHDLIQYIK